MDLGVTCGRPMNRDRGYKTPKSPELHWGPPSLQFNGYQKRFIPPPPKKRVKNCRSANLYTQPKLKAEVMSGWIYTSTHPTSLRGVHTDAALTYLCVKYST